MESLQLLLNEPQTARILELIELALDLMIRTASVDQPTADGRTASAIVARIFNTTAGCLREALNGYYQTSFALMRDLVEVGTLLDYFTIHRDKIARWREVTNDERLREFKPSALRKVLDDRDGFKEGKRKADYQAFSEHAAHLTYPALRMLQTPEGHTRLGPSLNEGHLRECVFELGRRVALCSMIVPDLLDKTVDDGDVTAAARLLADTRRFQSLAKATYRP
jgi:hypothetical protein